MTIRVQPATRTDILRQVGYYAELGRPDVAERFLAAVEAAFSSLQATPAAGTPKQFAHPDLSGLRSWPVRGFEDIRLYYVQREQELIVLRILHGRRDIDGIFNDLAG